MNGWRVTYEIVTPESAEHGDAAEHGFIDADGSRIAPLIGRPTPGVGMSFREALAEGAFRTLEDSGSWFTEADGRRHSTGAEERRSLHPPETISAASYGRVARLLGVH